MLKAIRDHFDQSNCWEADVPCLAPALVPEAGIHPFKTEWLTPSGQVRTLWLLPSPEFYLKQLLAEGSPDLFYLGKAYRNAETAGRLHHPEFTIVEWYRRGRTEEDLLSELGQILERVGREAELPPCLRFPPEHLDLRQAFALWAGVDWSEALEAPALEDGARRLGPVPLGMEWGVLWSWLFVERVEPHLPRDRPVVLQGWPALLSAQAANEGVVARRWELFAGGVELVNACLEATDPRILEERAREAVQALNQPYPSFPSSDAYRRACSRLGTVAGAAMGFDRLLMLLAGRFSLGEVIFFSGFGTIGGHE